MRSRRAAVTAILLLATALARAEAPTPGRYEEAKAALQAKDLARAERLMSEAIEADPTDARAWNGRGVVRWELGNREGAVADVERAIAIRDDSTSRYMAAQYERERRRFGPARLHARRCVELDPKKARAWALLADLEMLHEDRVPALHALDEALRLDPNDERVKRVAASILSYLENDPALRQALSERRARPAPEALQHHARGGELAAAGKMREAIGEWEAALRVDPAFADCHYDIAAAADALGDLERAEREYLLALDHYLPEESLLRADALNNLVYVRVRRGKAGPEDVARAREAIALDRERPSKLDTLARACDAVGDRACAYDAYARVAASREQVPDEVRRNAEERLRVLRAAE